VASCKTAVVLSPHNNGQFKCMMGYAQDSLFSKYTQRVTITKRTARSSQMLNIPLYKTATGQRTFYFRPGKLWNSLDSTLKMKPTVKNFKRCLKKPSYLKHFRDLTALLLLILSFYFYLINSNCIL